MCHHHLAMRAMLKVWRSRSSIPPSLFDLNTCSQYIRRYICFLHHPKGICYESCQFCLEPSVTIRRTIWSIVAMPRVAIERMILPWKERSLLFLAFFLEVWLLACMDLSDDVSYEFSLIAWSNYLTNIWKLARPDILIQESVQFRGLIVQNPSSSLFIYLFFE